MVEFAEIQPRDLNTLATVTLRDAVVSTCVTFIADYVGAPTLYFVDPATEEEDDSIEITPSFRTQILERYWFPFLRDSIGTIVAWGFVPFTIVTSPEGYPVPQLVTPETHTFYVYDDMKTRTAWHTTSDSESESDSGGDTRPRPRRGRQRGRRHPSRLQTRMRQVVAYARDGPGGGTPLSGQPPDKTVIIMEVSPPTSGGGLTSPLVALYPAVVYHNTIVRADAHMHTVAADPAHLLVTNTAQAVFGPVEGHFTGDLTGVEAATAREVAKQRSTYMQQVVEQHRVTAAAAAHGQDFTGVWTMPDEVSGLPVARTADGLKTLRNLVALPPGTSIASRGDLHGVPDMDKRHTTFVRLVCAKLRVPVQRVFPENIGNESSSHQSQFALQKTLKQWRGTLETLLCLVYRSVYSAADTRYVLRRAYAQFIQASVSAVDTSAGTSADAEHSARSVLKYSDFAARVRVTFRDIIDIDTLDRCIMNGYLDWKKSRDIVANVTGLEPDLIEKRPASQVELDTEEERLRITRESSLLEAKGLALIEQAKAAYMARLQPVSAPASTARAAGVPNETKTKTRAKDKGKDKSRESENTKKKKESDDDSDEDAKTDEDTESDSDDDGKDGKDEDTQKQAVVHKTRKRKLAPRTEQSDDRATKRRK